MYLIIMFLSFHALVATGIQLAALSSLLLLTPYDIALSTDTLRGWLSQSDSDTVLQTQPCVQDMTRQFLLTYQHRVPSLRDICLKDGNLETESALPAAVCT